MATALALSAVIAACAWSPVRPYEGHAPDQAMVQLVASGWHTGIGLPTRELSGPLHRLVAATPEAMELEFGWGQRRYYMAPHPGSADLLHAALPSRSVMLVEPLDSLLAASDSAGATVITLAISRPGLERLREFLWDYLAKGGHGQLLPLGAGLYPGSRFFASLGTYSMLHTCNSWAAQALHVAGVPVNPTGVLFARQLVGRALRAASDQSRITRPQSAL